MTFTATRNITDQIAEYLAESIIHGEISTGDRIYELKVAQELQVSRGSVREALLILERQRLISIAPRRGAIVTDLACDSVAELLTLLGVVQHQWIAATCEALPAHQVARHAPLRAQLEDAVTHMEGAAREGALRRLLRARGDFYSALLARSHGAAFGVFEGLLPNSHRVLRMMIDHEQLDFHDISRYYRALLSAFVESDMARLEQLMVAFNRRLLQLCARALGEPASRAVSRGLAHA